MAVEYSFNNSGLSNNKNKLFGRFDDNTTELQAILFKMACETSHVRLTPNNSNSYYTYSLGM